MTVALHPGPGIDRFAALALEAISAAVVATDLDGSILYWNEAAQRLFGWRDADVVGRRAVEVLALEMTEAVSEEILATVQGGDRWSGELWTCGSTGQRFPVSLSATGLHEHGRLVAIVAVSADMTGWHELDDARCAAERRYWLGFDSATTGLAIVGIDGRFEHVNPAMCRLLDSDASEIIGRGPTDFIDEAASGRVSDQMIEMLSGRTDAVQDEYGIQRTNGTVIWSLVSVTLIRDDAGTPDYFLVQTQDISDRKRADAERRRAEVQLRTALDTFVAAVATAAELRDPYTAGHQRRVARIAIEIATQLGLDDDTVEGIGVAAAIHDIGKIAVPAEILNRPGRLTGAEFEVIKAHARAGHDIIADVEFPWPVARMILEHHERMDGSGYPAGLVGDQILLGSRVLAVADVIEAVSAHRPYRPALGVDEAIERVTQDRGTLFDTNVVDACLSLYATGRLTDLRDDAPSRPTTYLETE